jgi:integrase
LRSWSAATDLVRDWEAAGEIGVVKKPEVPTIAEAVEPGAAVKSPKVHGNPTLPFSNEEMQRILEACDRYPGRQERLRAFVLMMRHTGLRIGDTLALDE